MPVRLVVGLGNPGAQYSRSRHNLGFRVLDRLMPSSGDWRKWKESGNYGEAEIGADKIFCVRPLTFMNLSGQMVSEFSRYYRIDPPEILICYDDFAIDLGRLRIRTKGSAGGHNGMQSIIEALGTQNIPRLRIGIGPLPPGRDAAQFVLEKASAKTEAQISDAVQTAADAVRMIIASGLEPAMNRYNAAPGEKEASPGLRRRAHHSRSAPGTEDS